GMKHFQILQAPRIRGIRPLLQQYWNTAMDGSGQIGVANRPKHRACSRVRIHQFDVFRGQFYPPLWVLHLLYGPHIPTEFHSWGMKIQPQHCKESKRHGMFNWFRKKESLVLEAKVANKRLLLDKIPKKELGRVIGCNSCRNDTSNPSGGE